jgi:hypothetical protein
LGSSSTAWRKSVGVALLGTGFHAQAVGFERFERRRGDLLDGNIKFLNRGQRLTQVFAQRGGRFADCLQNMLATVGFGLRLVPPEAAFEEFKAYVQKFDPIELLCQLTMTFLFTPEGFQGEASDTRRWARWIEFTAGYLATVPPRSEQYLTFNGAHIEEFERIILQYFHSFLYEAVNRPPGTSQWTPSDRVLQSAKTYSLWVRGDAYPHQFFEYSLELYGEHDDWFRANLGFTIQEAVRIFRAVTDQLERRFNESANNARANAPAKSDKHWEEAKAAGLTRKDLESRIAIHLHYGNGAALLRFTAEQLSQSSELPIAVCSAFLKRMSQPFGYRNPKFASTFSDPLKAPWDYNTMDERPFIERDGFYWFFTNPMVPSVLFHTFFFDLMNDRQYCPRFEKARGQFGERKVQLTGSFPPFWGLSQR